MTRDITDRKRAEEHLRLIIDTIPALVSSTLPDGSLDSVNRRLLEYLGRPLEEILLCGWKAAIHPEDLARVMNDWLAAVTAGKPVEMESRVRRADGEYRWFLHRSVPLRDELGNVVKWYSVSTDIEDRRKAEDALRRSEGQLAEAQRLAHIGSWDWNLRSGALIWSDELYRIVGLQRDSFVPSFGAFLDVVHPYDRAMVNEVVESALKTRETINFLLRIVRPGGEVRTIHSRGEVVCYDVGNPTRMFGTVQDVTDQQQAEHELRELAERLQVLSRRVVDVQEEERRRLARELHDEIGQVLSAVRINLKAGQTQCDAPVRPRLEESIKIVDQATQQVRNLSLELRPAMLDDLGLLPTLRWYADQQAQRAGFALQFTAESSGRRLPADVEIACYRVVQEALTNVVRHAQAQQVSLEFQEDEKEIAIAICDDGIGFDLNTVRERTSRGISLGVLGMQERVAILGGQIHIRSTPNQGTTIRIHLPLVRHSAS